MGSTAMPLYMWNDPDGERYRDSYFDTYPGIWLGSLAQDHEQGIVLDDDLVARIRARVREDCSPRHVTDEVVAVQEVPRRLSGKVLELPVKRILTGTPSEQAASRDSLHNPAALDLFVNARR